MDRPGVGSFFISCSFFAPESLDTEELEDDEDDEDMVGWIGVSTGWGWREVECRNKKKGVSSLGLCLSFVIRKNPSYFLCLPPFFVSTFINPMVDSLSLSLYFFSPRVVHSRPVKRGQVQSK